VEEDAAAAAREGKDGEVGLSGAYPPTSSGYALDTPITASARPPRLPGASCAIALEWMPHCQLPFQGWSVAPAEVSR